MEPVQGTSVLVLQPPTFCTSIRINGDIYYSWLSCRKGFNKSRLEFVGSCNEITFASKGFD
uniref:Uncharacterized protein n=1 Tax=Rhizophora mucronata TaxID=61149 RepID=A0A2P2J8S0_RHIMU